MPLSPEKQLSPDRLKVPDANDTYDRKFSDDQNQLPDDLLFDSGTCTIILACVLFFFAVGGLYFILFFSFFF